MTGQEPRDDEREALARRLEREFGSFLAQWPADPDRFFGQAADGLIRDGYRKNREPEYEYGLRADDGDEEPWSDVSADPDFLTDGWVPDGSHFVRRVKAGPWVPVGEGEQAE